MFTKRVIFSLFIIHCSIVITNAQWVDSYSGTTATFHKCQMVNNKTAFIVGDSGIVMKTTNLGANWTRLNVGTSFGLNAIDFINENTGYVGGARIYKTTNGGLNWASSANLTGSVYDICFLNTNFGMYANDYGVGKTTNGGLTWTDVCCFQEGFITLYGITILDSNIAYGVGDQSIVWQHSAIEKTTNGGLNWVDQDSYVVFRLYSVAFINVDTGFAVGAYDVLTTNGGLPWRQVNFGAGTLNSIHYLTPKIITACGNNNIIIRSTDGGVNWGQQYFLLSGEMNSISFIGLDTGIAVGIFGKILITTQGSVIGIQQISSQVPKNFYLYQNYPNPFNPNTKIKFDIPENSKGQNSNVKLEIYDVLGREVGTIVDKQLKPGSYEADWPVEYGQNKYPSGIYFYSLQTEGYRETKKMILLK